MPKNNDKSTQCRSCKGEGEYYHSGGGCGGGALYLDCRTCDGTGVHNQEKYIESRKEGLRFGIRNLESALERDKIEVPKKIAELQEKLQSLERYLEEQKKTLADLDNGILPEDEQ